MRRRVFCLILLAMASGLAANSFSQAEAHYKNKEYDKALLLFIDFAKNNKKSNKADDAWYYAGKIQLSNGDKEAAEKSFTRVLKRQNRSSKHKMALAQVAPLWKDKKEYTTIITALENENLLAKKSKTNTLLIQVLADSYYQQGREVKTDTSLYLKAIPLYKHLLSSEESLTNRVQLARTYRNLFRLTNEEQYRKMGLEEAAVAENLDTGSKRKKTIQSIQKALSVKEEPKKKTKLELTGELTGGYELNPGLKGYVELTGKHPLSDSHRFDWSLKGDYNSFSLKTFNFLKENKEKEDKYFQWTAGGSGDVTWRYRGETLSSRFRITGDLTTAEDPEDASRSLSVKEDLSLNLTPWLKADLDLGWNMKVFPNYYISGRKLDYTTLSAEPEFTFIITPVLSLTAGADISYKNYLDSRYDALEDPQVPDSFIQAEQNKSCLTWIPKVELETGVIKNTKITLSYGFEIRDSSHYDKKITYSESGLSETMLVADYWDAKSHNAELKIRITPSELFKLSLKGALSQTNFTTYPARNSHNELTGELREDMALNASVEAKYQVIKNRMSLIFITDYFSNSSNMLYETSFLTNYSALTFFAGVSWNI